MPSVATAVDQVLITGSAGQLGQALQHAWATKPNAAEGQLLAKPRESFDISDEQLVSDWLPTLMPAAVVNCAGYTNVSQAENEREACWEANVRGVANLAKTCAEHDIPLIHLSTDFVYGQDYALRVKTAAGALDEDEQPPSQHDIAQRLTYRDSCPPGPINFYGQTKLAAEHVILRQASETPEFNYWIIRTAGLFERPWRQGRNFPYAIASKLFRQRQPIEVANDVQTNICAAEDLAQTIVWMVENARQWSKKGFVCPRGIYHVANEGSATWFEIARTLAGHMGMRTRIVPTTHKKYADSQGLRSSSPNYSCMDMSKYRSLGGPVMPTWQNAVQRWAEQAKDFFS
jgi:dTDP-4-dehydrorhamnose reductase